MKVVRYIIDDRGIVLIVDAPPSDQMAGHLRSQFDEWAQMVGGSHFPLLVLPGDENTKVDDLRTFAAPLLPSWNDGSVTATASTR